MLCICILIKAKDMFNINCPFFCKQSLLPSIFYCKRTFFREQFCIESNWIFQRLFISRTFFHRTLLCQNLGLYFQKLFFRELFRWLPFVQSPVITWHKYLLFYNFAKYFLLYHRKNYLKNILYFFSVNHWQVGSNPASLSGTGLFAAESSIIVWN